MRFRDGARVGVLRLDFVRPGCPAKCVTLSLDKGLFLCYIIRMISKERKEMFELVGIAVAAVIVTPIAILVLVMLLSL